MRERVHDPLEGRDRLSRYELIRRIGSGGVAVVYQGCDPERDNPECDPRLSGLIAGCLIKDRERRLAGFEPILGELEALHSIA